MSNNCGIYKIVSKTISDRYYIGSSVNIQNRWKRHIRELKTNKHHSIKLQRHVNKYGIEDLKFVILTECSKKELLIKEQSFLDVNFPYFNTNKKAGCANNGSPWNKGKKMKIPVWNKGKKMDEAQKLKMFGHNVSEETREKLRNIKLGKTFNITENILNRNKKLCVPVLQFDKDGNFIKKYDSLKETVMFGFQYQHISACCRGKRKSAGGYVWKYEKDYY
jgi:group I intron endonuclease